MKRREFLLGTCASLALLASRGWGGSGEKKLNVLFIAIDDLNAWIGALHVYPDVQTPNIDRLAKQGMLFTRAYCNAPSCNPSRVSALTGLRPSTSEVYANEHRLRKFIPQAITLPQHFKASGYEVVGGGKVFHGEFPYSKYPFDEKMPPSLPWHHFDNERSSWDAYYTFPNDPVPSQASLSKFGKKVFDWGPTPWDDQSTPDAQLANWAADYLSKPHDRPFFLAVGFYRPHLPWYIPKQYFDLYQIDKIVLPNVKLNDLDDIPEIPKEWAANQNDHEDIVKSNNWKSAVQGYLASITFVDHQLGKVLDTLNSSPYAPRTIVVLWSDHGFHLGEKLHWRKFTLWEEATRVPLIIVHPDGAWPHAPCERVVSLLDIYPSLLDLCGLDHRPDLEGRSLVPLLKDPDMRWELPAISTWGSGNHSVRTEQWRYTQYRDGTEELYDHAKDPHEWHNLAALAASQVVKQDLQRWLQPLYKAEHSLQRKFHALMRRIRQ
jgi:arylsulfatase A-like enzyme